jgi:hypothetical protein
MLKIESVNYLYQAGFRRLSGLQKSSKTRRTMKSLQVYIEKTFKSIFNTKNSFYFVPQNFAESICALLGTAKRLRTCSRDGPQEAVLTKPGNTSFLVNGTKFLKILNPSILMKLQRNILIKIGS